MTGNCEHLNRRTRDFEAIPEFAPAAFVRRRAGFRAPTADPVREVDFRPRF